MNHSKAYAKRSFHIILIYTFVAGLGLCALAYYGLDFFLRAFSTEEGRQILVQGLPVFLNYLEQVHQKFYLWMIPPILGIALVLGFMGWLGLYVKIFSSLDQADAAPAGKQKTGSEKKDFIAHKIEQDRQQRLFLHNLSVLQREGRLLDFFDEDLSLYEDAQIGAAVRSIQEDCKKAVKKYIDPRPVIDSQEGEWVTVEPGFDMDSISLVGNVAGDPPFQGVLKHRGWKAGRKEIPKLSDIQDSGIIIPAQVEIR